MLVGVGAFFAGRGPGFGRTRHNNEPWRGDGLNLAGYFSGGLVGRTVLGRRKLAVSCASGCRRASRGHIHRSFESKSQLQFQFFVGHFPKPSRKLGMGHGNSDCGEMQLILERIDPTKNVARYYGLSVEATLFARNTFVRRWGRIGSTGRQRLEFFDNKESAGLTLDTWLARKRKRGYVLR